MSLFETWRSTAYQEQNQQESQKFWDSYFEVERDFYANILSNAGAAVEGNFSELAERFGVDKMIFMGFLDGINDSLVNPQDLENMTEESAVKLEIDYEKLYYNMLEAKAEWLYNLPQWDNILAEDKRKEITKAQRVSHTYVKPEPEVGRNEPCPCGSGKKYKKCCGGNK